MKKIIASILMSSILLYSTPAFAKTINKNTQTKQTVKPLILTKYKWHTNVYTSPYKWYRVVGPDRGGFNLKNLEGTHYKTLYIEWSSNVTPKNMKIEIKNDDTGGIATQYVYGKSGHTYFTSLRAGHYTVYVMTGNWNSFKFYVEDLNSGW